MRNLLFLVMLFPLILSAQVPEGLRFGALGGVNISSFHTKGGEFKQKPGFYSGLSVDYLFKNVFITIEGAYSQKGAYSEEIIYNENGDKTRHTYKGNFIDIPLIIGGREDNFRFYGGFVTSFLMDAKHIPGNNVSGITDLNLDFDKRHFGWLFGLGGDIPLNRFVFTLDGRYGRGYTAVADENYQISTFQFLVGVKFSISNRIPTTAGVN